MKSCKIANSEEGMEKLFEHTLQRQLAEQKQATEALQAQMAEMTALLKSQLSPTAAAAPRPAGVAVGAASPRPAGVAVGAAGVVNAGPTQNIHVERPVTQTVTQVIQIAPWDSDRRIAVGALEIAQAFAENTRLQEYAGWTEREMTDPEQAPPYVTELLMDLTKRAHVDPAARNVYLNPRRSDQVLVHMKSEKWEVLPLQEATRLLLDGLATNISRAMMTPAELKQLPLEAQNAVSLAKMMYQGEPEEYVQRAKAPMSAHLANVAPTPAPAQQPEARQGATV